MSPDDYMTLYLNGTAATKKGEEKNKGDGN